MEERKTAAIVLSIVALIGFFFTVVMPYIKLNRTYTLAYDGCSIPFRYDNSVDEKDPGYISAQNKLGLCLSNQYYNHPEPKLSRYIMQLYINYSNSYANDSIRYNLIDSVVTNRERVFDPKYGWED
jgi:hypothetical protein